MNDGVSLATILALEKTERRLFPDEFRPLLEQPLKYSNLITVTLSTNSYDDPKGSRAELGNIELSNLDPVALIQPAVGESLLRKTSFRIKALAF